MSKPFIIFFKNWIIFYYCERLGWFRFFNFGIKWKDISLHPLRFSERNGLQHGIQLGNWRISSLRG